MLRLTALVDAIERLAAAAAIVLEVIGHGAGHGVGSINDRVADGEALFLHAPQARRALRLREVEDGLCVGVLQIIGESKLALAIGTLIVAPARDPAAAGCAPAVTEMQALFDHTPVRFAGDGKA